MSSIVSTLLPGYPEYCPQPGDPGHYTHCCTNYNFGGAESGCCPLPLAVSTIAVIALCGIILVGSKFSMYKLIFKDTLYSDSSSNSPIFQL